MDHLAAFSKKIEDVFSHIAETRMEGVPILNPALGVGMRGMRRFDVYHAGMLVTPWFMNLFLLPMEQPKEPMRVGQKCNIALPSGAYEAVWSHEEALGGYWSVSLFSPMFEFDAMKIALETAEASMELMFSVPDEADAPDFTETMVQPGPGRDVGARLTEEEEKEAERNKSEEAAGTDRPVQMDRRALFGMRRKASEEEVA